MRPSTSELRLLQAVSARGLHPNVLIVCDDRVAARVVPRVTRWSAGPFHRCTPGVWQLPARDGGTLVVNAVEHLTPHQQGALFEWTHGEGLGMQVVSVAREDLPARILAGAFLEALFFRLNVVQLELNCGPTPQARRPATTG